MERLFLASYRFFSRRRPLLYGIFLLLLLTFAAGAYRVRFEEDITRILPVNKDELASLTLFRESRFSDQIVVSLSLVDSLAEPQPDSLLSAGQTLVEQLATTPAGLIHRIRFRVPDSAVEALPKIILQHLPVFLEDADYASLDSMQTTDGIRQSLMRNLDILQKPTGFILKDLLMKDAGGISFLALRKLNDLQAADSFQLYQGAVMHRDLRHLLLFVTPAFPAGNTGENTRLVEHMEQVVTKLQKSHPQIRMDYIGAPVIAVANARQLRKDSILSLSLTVLLLMVFLTWVFRNLLAPVLVMIPVVFGGLFALAMIYLLQGSISMIAVAAGSVVMGIAVNYSVHVFNHYRHTFDAEEVVRVLAKPLTIGSLTTIGGFFCMRFAALDMLRDLGLFAGLSLLAAALCSLIFLPHFVQQRRPLNRPAAEHFAGWTNSIRLGKSVARGIMFLILLLTIFFAYHARNVRFEPDMMSMNYMPAALKASEARFNRLTDYGSQSVYLMTEGRALDEALSKLEQLQPVLDSLRKAGLLNRYQTASRILPSDSVQRSRIRKWERYWTEDRKASYLQLLRSEGISMGFTPAAFVGFEQLLRQSYQPFSYNQLPAFQQDFLEDYLTMKPGQASVMTILKAEPGASASLYAALGEYPEAMVFDKQMLTRSFMGMVRTDFMRIALYTSLLVFVALWITYGRIELALISYVPMFISWIWILGIMSLAGLTFNIVNIIISALIFGLGDDYSIYAVNGSMEEYKTGKRVIDLHRSSVFISAITTLAGLGVLLLSKHPSLRSVSLMSMVGIFCVVLISQYLIPRLFSALISNRTKKGKMPFTLVSLLVSLFAFVYFVLGSILLWVLGFVLVFIRPFGKERSKYIFHWLISKFVASLVYIMANVRKTIENPLQEDFSKPAVVICNHQSFLDILITVMLHPRLILLTNDWVWNSPVFGFIVRMADYYPVSMGAEQGLDKLRAMTDQGYSIVVFPEGTRSLDGQIKRFHKGAFYIAEKLGLDILPIVLHGTGYAMPKNDFLLKNGHMTIRFLPRIKPGDQHYGDGYAERAKQIAVYFRKAYEELVSERENPSYFHQQLMANYLYKGPVLEWYVRVKLKLEGNYDLYHRYLPGKGAFLDLGCGYGFVAYSLYLASKQRNFTGVDHDAEKVALAKHCFSRPARMDFLQGDIRSFPLDRYQGILLLDVLHYIPLAQQEEFLTGLMKALEPGGVLIVKEADADQSGRHARTRFTEYLSTRFFGFNQMQASGLSFVQGKIIEQLAGACGLSIVHKQQNRSTSNTVYVIKREISGTNEGESI